MGNMEWSCENCDIWIKYELPKIAAELATVQESEGRRARQIESLERKMLDIESQQFADSIEREIDLARWKDGIAASVGHDLEDVADVIWQAIEKTGKGEDATSLLYEAHMNLENIIGDLLSLAPEESEEAI